jgi:hypothetical protein
MTITLVPRRKSPTRRAPGVGVLARTTTSRRYDASSIRGTEVEISLNAANLTHFVDDHDVLERENLHHRGPKPGRDLFWGIDWSINLTTGRNSPD